MVDGAAGDHLNHIQWDGQKNIEQKSVGVIAIVKSAA
jgi:hypothetical protein